MGTCGRTIVDPGVPVSPHLRCQPTLCAVLGRSFKVPERPEHGTGVLLEVLAMRDAFRGMHRRGGGGTVVLGLTGGRSHRILSFEAWPPRFSHNKERAARDQDYC